MSMASRPISENSGGASGEFTALSIRQSAVRRSMRSNSRFWRSNSVASACQRCGVAEWADSASSDCWLRSRSLRTLAAASAASASTWSCTRVTSSRAVSTTSKDSASPNNRNRALHRARRRRRRWRCRACGGGAGDEGLNGALSPGSPGALQYCALHPPRRYAVSRMVKRPRRRTLCKAAVGATAQT